MFAAIVLAFPQQLKSSRALPLLSRWQQAGPRVSVSIDNFLAVAPEHAYDSLIEEAASVHRVDPALIRSVMASESAFDTWAVSRAGAQGLMQLMPDIAAAFGVENPFDPRQNIMAGTQLLRELLDQHHGDLALTLASYNAGAGVVAQYGEVPPFRETQDYVKRVSDLLADAHASP
jgi:soluble lytic murein transglycosylase-like protein